MYIYIYTYIHAYICIYSGYFQVSTIVNSAAMDIGVHVPFQIIVLSGYMPNSETAGSYGSSIFSFLEESL